MTDAKALQLAALNLQVATVDQTEAARMLVAQIDGFIAERVRIADVLATFHGAALSMSSVQPLLTLAEELNPSLRRPREAGDILTAFIEKSHEGMSDIAAVVTRELHLSARPCGCDVSAGWVCEQHRS